MQPRTELECWLQKKTIYDPNGKQVTLASEVQSSIRVRCLRNKVTGVRVVNGPNTWSAT